MLVKIEEADGVIIGGLLPSGHLSADIDGYGIKASTEAWTVLCQLLDEVAELHKRMRRINPVVEAAAAWRGAQSEMFCDLDHSAVAHNALIAAVDAWQEGK